MKGCTDAALGAEGQEERRGVRGETERVGDRERKTGMGRERHQTPSIRTGPGQCLSVVRLMAKSEK